MKLIIELAKNCFMFLKVIVVQVVVIVVGEIRNGEVETDFALFC